MTRPTQMTCLMILNYHFHRYDGSPPTACHLLPFLLLCGEGAPAHQRSPEDSGADSSVAHDEADSREDSMADNMVDSKVDNKVVLDKEEGAPVWVPAQGRASETEGVLAHMVDARILRPHR